MTRFLLFVSSIIFALSVFFFGTKGHFDEQKIPDMPIQNSGGDISTDAVKNIPQASGTTTPPKKLAPVVLVPKETIAPMSQKAVLKVAAPLVHYTAEKVAPNTLSSAKVITWTNTYREQNNLKALKRNSQLDAAAIIKAHDMFDRQYFEHISPTGKSPADLISGVGYEYLWEGENLALGIFSDEKDLVDAWMASPGHRANILNSHFEEIGVGVDEGTYEGKHAWIAVQEFGKPSSSCPVPEVSTKTEIEQNRKKIDELSAQANNLILEINAPKNKNDTTAYNLKVMEYNALVAELNSLVQNTKSLVDVYNKEINEYNVCIEA